MPGTLGGLARLLRYPGLPGKTWQLAGGWQALGERVRRPLDFRRAGVPGHFQNSPSRGGRPQVRCNDSLATVNPSQPCVAFATKHPSEEKTQRVIQRHSCFCFGTLGGRLVLCCIQ